MFDKLLKKLISIRPVDGTARITIYADGSGFIETGLWSDWKFKERFQDINRLNLDVVCVYCNGTGKV